MKRCTVWTMALLMTWTVLAGGSALAEDGLAKGASASAGVFSNYVWRGMKLSDKAVVQPSAGITYGGFGASLWANYDTDIQEHTETDLTLSYGHGFGPLSVDLGYIYYALDGFDDTQEVYVKIGYDILLNPSLTYYHDFDQGDGGYLVAAIGHTFELGGDITLGLGASASMNLKNAVLGTDKNGEEFSDFYNGEVSASLSVPVYDAISLGVLVAYTFPLSDDGENAIESLSVDRDSDILYGGVTVSIAF